MPARQVAFGIPQDAQRELSRAAGEAKDLTVARELRRVRDMSADDLAHKMGINFKTAIALRNLADAALRAR